MSVRWVKNGVVYNIELSDKPKYKLKATYINPLTKRQNTIYFGAVGYQHYRDITGLLPREWNHYDPERRRLYRARHKNDNLDRPSSGLLSWYLLW